MFKSFVLKSFVIFIIVLAISVTMEIRKTHKIENKFIELAQCYITDRSYSCKSNPIAIMEEADRIANFCEEMLPIMLSLNVLSLSGVFIGIVAEIVYIILRLLWRKIRSFWS